jgi:trimeric autotransporter adhesin
MVVLALSPTGQAVSPAPDGDYGNFNTAEGGNALLNLDVSRAGNNTAIGSNALVTDQVGVANTAVGSGALAGNYASNNTAVGFQSLLRNSAGDNNTAIGLNALLNYNFTGSTAVGANALASSVNGVNTAVGLNALTSNNGGTNNTAVGSNALASNTQGNGNTAVGSNALNGNTGGYNVAVGLDALRNNGSGASNIAIGVNALYSNAAGTFNTAIGFSALSKASAAGEMGDIAVGAYALESNSTGTANIAVGVNGLISNTTGNNNIGVGRDALSNNQTGSGNIAVGYRAGTAVTGSNNIEIGNIGLSADSGKIRIGTKGTHNATFVAGIFNKTVSNSTPVFINANGQLGTVQSSARYKEAIKPMAAASEAVLALKPVTFRYKEELDPDGIPQFGLVAEEVEKVDPNLVVRDDDGKVMTVRYEAVNAMLLNEFLKEHRKVEEQEQTIADLNSAVRNQQEQIESLSAGLRKLRAHTRSGRR